MIAAFALAVVKQVAGRKGDALLKFPKKCSKMRTSPILDHFVDTSKPIPPLFSPHGTTL